MDDLNEKSTNHEEHHVKNLEWIYRDDALREYYCSDEQLSLAIKKGDVREKAEPIASGGFYSRLNVSDLQCEFPKRKHILPDPEKGHRTAWYTAAFGVGGAIVGSEIIAPFRALRGEKTKKPSKKVPRRRFARRPYQSNLEIDRPRVRQQLDLTLSGAFLKDIWRSKNYKDLTVHFPESELRYYNSRIYVPSPELLIALGRDIVFEFHMDLEIFLRDEILNSEYYKGDLFTFSTYDCFMPVLFNESDLEYVRDDPFEPIKDAKINIESFLMPIGACAYFIHSWEHYLESIWDTRKKLRKERKIK